MGSNINYCTRRKIVLGTYESTWEHLVLLGAPVKIRGNPLLCSYRYDIAISISIDIDTRSSHWIQPWIQRYSTRVLLIVLEYSSTRVLEYCTVMG